MKNLKRFLAVLVVVTMMVTTMIPAVAASTLKYEKEAEDLYSLGLYKGESTEEFVPALEKALDRQTGAVMLLRLFGQEEEALAMDSADVTEALKMFTDASKIADWAKRQVAFAVEQGYIKGVPVGTKFEFQPTKPLVGKAYASLILQQLGHDDFTYGEAVAKIAEVGGLTEEQVEEFEDKALIRDDLVGMSFGALTAKDVDGKTVAQKLVDKEVLNADQVNELVPGAVEMPTPTPTPTPAVVEVTYAVSAVTATNGTINVVMDKDITSAQAADFSVTQAVYAGTATTATTTSVTSTVYGYTADTKTAVLNVTPVAQAADEQNVYYTVAYKGGAAVTTAAVKVEALAKTMGVESVTATNLRQVVVVFNQKVDETSAETTSNYTGVTTVNTAVMQEDGKTVILNCATLSNDTEYTLTVKNVKSLDALRTIADTAVKFKANDTTIPTIKSVTVLGNKGIKVEFAEPVQEAVAENLANYSSVNETLTAGGDTAVLDSDIDDKTFTKLVYTFANTLTPGEHKIRINATGAIKDFNNYAVPAQDFTINVPLDTQAPTVSDIRVLSRTEVEVTFSEAVKDFAGAQIFWNTSGSTTGGTTSNETVTKVTESKYKVKFTGSSALPVGNVYVVVSNTTLKDYSNNVMSANYSKQLVVAADVLPAITTVSATSDTAIDVNYNKIMDQTTTETVGNYTLKDSSGTIKTISTVTFDTTNKNKVTLNFSSALTGGTYTLTVANVKDAVNVNMATATMNVAVTDTTPATITAVNVDAGGSKILAFTASEELATTGANSALSISNYQYAADGLNYGDLPSGTTITITTDKKTVRIDMPDTTTVTPLTSNLKIGYLKAASSYYVADASNNLIPSTILTVATGAAAIDVSVDIASIQIASATTLKVVLSSRVWGDISASDFQITKDAGSNWINPVSMTLDSNDSTKKTVIFTISDSDKFTAADSTRVKVKTITSVATTTDNYGVKAVSNKTSAAMATNKIAAKVVGAVLKDSTTIQVLFDAPIDFASGSDIKLANSIVVTQGTTVINGLSANTTGKFDTVTNDVTLTNANADRKIAIFNIKGTEAETLLLDQPVNVKTVSADLMTALDANGNLITANTTGFEAANTLVAYKLDTTDANGTLANTENFQIIFNRNIDTTTIKSGWDGTTTLTNAADATSVTFRTDGTMIVNGATVGTIEGFTVGTQETVAASVSYSSSTKTLTVALTAAPNGTLTHIGGLVFKPDASIKSSSGTAITAAYEAQFVDNIKPLVSSITWANVATAGTLAVGDTITVVFNEAIDSTTLGMTTAPTAGGAGVDEAAGDNLITWTNATEVMTIKGVAAVKMTNVTADGSNDQIWTVAVSADGKTVTYTLKTAGTIPTIADSTDAAGAAISSAAVKDLAGNAPADDTDIDDVVADASTF